MGLEGPLSSPITWMLLGLALAVCANGAWKLVSRSTWLRKLRASPPATPNSVESRLATIEGELVVLFSTLEKLTTQMRRTLARYAQAESREKGAPNDEPPPLGSPKEVLRDYYRRKGILKTGAGE